MCLAYLFHVSLNKRQVYTIPHGHFRGLIGLFIHHKILFVNLIIGQMYILLIENFSFGKYEVAVL